MSTLIGDTKLFFKKVSDLFDEIDKKLDTANSHHAVNIRTSNSATGVVFEATYINNKLIKPINGSESSNFVSFRASTPEDLLVKIEQFAKDNNRKTARILYLKGELERSKRDVSRWKKLIEEEL